MISYAMAPSGSATLEILSGIIDPGTGEKELKLEDSYIKQTSTMHDIRAVANSFLLRGNNTPFRDHTHLFS